MGVTRENPVPIFSKQMQKIAYSGFNEDPVDSKVKKQETTEINEEAGWEAERVDLLLVSMV